MKPEFRGAGQPENFLPSSRMRSRESLSSCCLTALFPHPPRRACAPNRFYLYPPFRRHREQSRHGGGAEGSWIRTKQRTLDVECSPAPSLHLRGCGICLRGLLIGLQATGTYGAQPEMLVGVNGKMARGPRRNVHGPGYAFFALNSSGDPYNLFSLPSHLQGESVIGITRRSDPDERSDTDATCGRFARHQQDQRELSRAFGVYIGWNWRLWDSSGCSASMLR